MSEYLSAAAAALGAPEALVERSANARAQATGGDPEEILKAWAGGEAAPAAAAAPSEPTPEPTPEPAAAEAPPETSPEPEPQPAPAALEPAAAPAAVSRVAAPSRVGPEEALDYDVVVSVPTVGIKERTSSAVPRWLATLFTIIPVFGLLYLAGNIGTEATACTDGGLTLAVDRVSGELENCDGSAFEGRGDAGGGAAQFLVRGEEIYATCAACHGANGGGGVGPALNAVLSDFGSCSDQLEWVTLGSSGFLAADRTTYGDIGKPVNGGMPGFGTSLSAEEIASVVSFERVRFGGGDPGVVLADCGLVTEDGGGSDGTDGTDGAQTDQVEAVGQPDGR
jgi:cytochrome c553